MKTLTVEEEIAALKYARRGVQSGKPYICCLIRDAVRLPWLQVIRLPLVREIREFLDGESCVESWLRVPTRYGVAKTFRIAVIDVLLARRGVFIKEEQ
jgi:hypothetical protein